MNMNRQYGKSFYLRADLQERANIAKSYTKVLQCAPELSQLQISSSSYRQQDGYEM
jgi:hypothetical protein